MRNDSLKYKANVFLSSMSAYEFINLLMLNIAHQWGSEENIRQKWNLSLSFHNSASWYRSLYIISA